MKKHLPNFFTSMNLLAGCMAVVMVFRDHMDWAAYLIFLAAFFDLLDGLAARILGLNSAYGKELDSLADMVSFGLVPGLIIFKMLQQSDLSRLPLSDSVLGFVQFVPFIITVFSALRLAKFNLDTRQKTTFIGLPVPANTLFIASLPMILIHEAGKYEILLLNPVVLLLLSIALSLLLISEIPLFSLKLKNLSLKDNMFQFILLVLSAILIPIFKWTAVPLIFGLYFLLSFFSSFNSKKN
ncbi:MAG TPA: CDP-alcohol phosphatidyltransferase family protein [Bacteroidia bacterium]|nr:CDP-alcohol phosphatidyltransferase family protein [Bacteroidia bacterium]HNS12032.1 CDP-alcohol phosphatidyltransferase family protein [Bacteroidia bacterium]